MYQLWLDLVRRPSSLLCHDCGIEALLFDRYLRFLLVIFSSSAVVITPTFTAFNYLCGSLDSSVDLLTRMSWSNLSPHSPKFYWFYALFIPSFSSYLLFMIARELERTKILGRSAIISQEQSPSPKFWLAVTELPSFLRHEAALRSHLGRWNDYITDILILPKQKVQDRLVHKQEELIRVIERHETSFIRKMTRHRKTNDQNDLRARLEQRHSRSTFKPVWFRGCLARLRNACLPYNYQPLHLLYELLLNTYSTIQGQRQVGAAVPGENALVSFNEASFARALSFEQDLLGLRFQYLGSELSHIETSHIRSNSFIGQIRFEGFNLGIMTLILIWTAPVGASGALSRLSEICSLLRHDLSLPIWLGGFLQGVAPQVITSILMSSFPYFLRLLTARKRLVTMEESQNSTQLFYFWFLFSQMVVTTSISSGLVPAIVQVGKTGIVTLPRILAQDLPQAGIYFLSYIMIEAIGEARSSLFRIPTIIKLYFDRGDKTPREQVDALYGIHSTIIWGETYPLYATLANIGTRVVEDYEPKLTHIGLIYALLTPLILPICTLCFCLLLLCARYKMRYTAFIPFETGGRLYFSAISSLFCGILTSELCFLGLFFLKMGRANLLHDIGQISIILLTLFGTLRYHEFLRRSCFDVPPTIKLASTVSQSSAHASFAGQTLSQLRLQAFGFPKIPKESVTLC